MKNPSVYCEEFIDLTTIFTEESIGKVSLARFTTKNTSSNQCILHSKPGQTHITDGFRFCSRFTLCRPINETITNFGPHRFASYNEEFANRNELQFCR